MIGFEEVQKERELKISTLKRELAEIKMAYDTIDLKYQTLEINYKKIDDQYTTLKRDNDDTVDKLHSMNKARYELETRISDENAKSKSLTDVLAQRDEQLNRRQQELEESDKKNIEKERELDNEHIKRQGIEK